MGAKVRCMVPVSDATAAIAVAGGVATEPIRISTLSSETKRRAFLVALAGSVASSRMITLSFWPPMLVGHMAISFLMGMPSADVGPVSDRLTPILMSASAAVAANAPMARVIRDLEYFMACLLG